MSYAEIIIFSCLVFPILAIIITIPYMLNQYSKYGSLPPIRVIIFYSFILYLLSSYFLVILPLPSYNEVVNMDNDFIQLIPLKSIYDVFTKSQGGIRFFLSHDLTQIVYNAILFIPFGIYLRYFFRFDLKKVIKYSFIFSLFFELTQLSGLYFIYPRPYRLFDIDDLIINTLGGILGFYLTKYFTFFLPTRDELELLSYKAGMKVSFVKRITSNCIDIICMLILLIPIDILLKQINSNINSDLSIAIVLIVHYMIMPIITKGYTIGKKIVNLRIMTFNNTVCNWYIYIIRYVLLFLGLLVIPYITVLLYFKLDNILSPNVLLIFFLTYFFILFLFLIYVFINNIVLKKPFLYERLTKTHNVSTIVVPNKLNKN